MTIADEKFFAWLDGELSPAEAALVETEVANSPELSRAAEEHRTMQTRLKDAFDAVVRAPLPDGMQPPSNVVDFAAAKRVRDKRHWGPTRQWAAIAATLIVGLLTGSMISTSRSAPGPVEVQGGRLYAASALNGALDKELASAPADSPVRIGMTFRNSAGAICRSFTDPQSSGLACRDGSRWQVRGLFAAPEGQQDTYRMASSVDPNLAALVDSTIAGDPLDAAQERAAKAKNWH